MVEAEAEVEVPAQEEVAVPATTIEAEDDLHRIEGIGPKIEDALKRAGIKTYAQLARMTGEELTRIVKEEARVRMVGDAATWAKQAQFLVNNDIEGLEAYQRSLTSGRERGQ
ncbi:MAG: hypothetical protein HC915_12765 [Anaerolineae bacterium]|nr:hypothetical protein [Anaerolineae bacterium]